MKNRAAVDIEDRGDSIQALLDTGEDLLWWDKLSEASIMGGAGRSLIVITLAVNLLILLLIFAPGALPWLDSVSWLLLPLLLVDCICLLFILLYFAFGIMTGGVNAISVKRVLVVDLNRKRIVREMALDSLREIKIRRRKGDRGSITLYRDGAHASARKPRRMKLDGIRQFERVVDLLQELTELDINDGR